MRYEVYADSSGEWRWRLVSRNGRIVADSGEGYTRKVDCRRAIRRVRVLAALSVVLDG